MASKSGGTIPPYRQIACANDAIGILDALHHWSSTVKNAASAASMPRRAYRITITHAGRRVSAQRQSFVDAAIAALHKLQGKSESTRLKLVGQGDRP